MDGPERGDLAEPESVTPLASTRLPEASTRSTPHLSRSPPALKAALQAGNDALAQATTIDDLKPKRLQTGVSGLAADVPESATEMVCTPRVLTAVQGWGRHRRPSVIKGGP